MRTSPAPAPANLRQRHSKAALLKAGGFRLPSVNLPPESAADLVLLKDSGLFGDGRGVTKAVVVAGLAALVKKHKLR